MQQKITICVVDDDEFVRLTICAALDYAGFDTVQARDGDAGLKEIQRVGAPIAIIDMIMPNKEGLETIMEAKTRFPGIKILAISGGGSTSKGQLLSMARELGADDCLAKPFRNEELIEKITRLVSSTDSLKPLPI